MASSLLAHPHRIYLGNLPFDVQAAALVTALLPACSPHDAHITVTSFGPKHRKKRGCEHKLHPGYGYVEVPGEVDVDALMLQLRAVETLAGAPVSLSVELSLCPAPLVPVIDSEDYLQPESEEVITKKRIAQRQHKKRQRTRINSRRNGALLALISQMPVPGGLALLKRYAPLEASAPLAVPQLELNWPRFWRDIPQCIDPAYDFVRNVALGEDSAREDRARQRAEQQEQKQEEDKGDEAGCRSCRSCSCTNSTSGDGDGDALPVGRSSALISDGGEHDGLTLRALRKRSQVESFGSALAQLLSVRSTGEAGGLAPLHIVDFGSGSGNLCLPLARLLPHCRFTAVDMNAHSVLLLQQRARLGGLSNVSALVGRIEDFDKPFDVAVALHACGVATDYALHKAQACRAAYIVCPCCIGKLKFGLKSFEVGDESSTVGAVPVADDEEAVVEEACSEITHPRSRWLSDALLAAASSAQISFSSHSTELDCSTTTLTPADIFAAMARAGDISHGEAHSGGTVGQTHLHAHEARLCKAHLELDRNMYMRERGYLTALLRLLRAELTGKSELLVGAPAEAVAERRLQFPWEPPTTENHDHMCKNV